jgi:hypothetical protein
MDDHDPRHGTEAGHEQHCRDDEQPCEPCHEAKILASRRRTKRKTMGYRYTVPAGPARARLQQWRDGGATYGEIADHTGVEESRIWEILNNPTAIVYTRTSRTILNTNGWPVTAASLTRRVRALCRLGWSIPKIAEACGAHHDTILAIRARQPQFASRKVRDGIVAGYAASAMTIPEATSGRDQAGITRARNHAERMGWAPPLAYDDIDDPAARPTGLRELPNRPKTEIDPVIVERLLNLQPVQHSTRAEREEAMRRWKAMGRSEKSLCETHGWKDSRYGRTAA